MESAITLKKHAAWILAFTFNARRVSFGSNQADVAFIFVASLRSGGQRGCPLSLLLEVASTAANVAVGLVVA